MKKLILILAIILVPNLAQAKCVDDPTMGKNFLRCENKEAVCYGFFIEDSLTSPQISCFKK